MKNLAGTIVIGSLFAALIAGCSKNDGVLDKASLKQAVNQSAGKLNTAVDAIAATKAYSILTISDAGTAKSLSATDSTYRVYIPLSKINGVYNYNKVTKSNNWGISLLHFFTRSADNSHMIVNMPLKKVTHPVSLRHFSRADTSLTNNFSIDVSDYHNNYNSYWDYDYLLSSAISIDSVLAGNLNISSIISPSAGIHYAAQYAFAGGYTVNYKYESGDTTLSSFSIMNGSDILYEEKLLTLKNDSVRFGHERQYILTIGNVQIIRKSGSNTAQIAVNGVVQPGAVVTIVDRTSDQEASVCKGRDVQITFEDGTVTTISSLISASVSDIKTLYTSLHQVFFAAYIVDWIAYDVYYGR